jgi:hypothetical protein
MQAKNAILDHISDGREIGDFLESGIMYVVRTMLDLCCARCLGTQRIVETASYLTDVWTEFRPRNQDMSTIDIDIVRIRWSRIVRSGSEVLETKRSVAILRLIDVSYLYPYNAVK